MITNIPTGNDFEKAAKESLIQAFHLIYKTDAEIDIFSTNSLDIPDFTEHEFNENYFSFWLHKQSVLRTTIVLIQQSHELFMKATIAQVSPLLLLENKRTEWPTLYKHNDKDFNNLYTLSAESLLHTYSAVLNAPAAEELIRFIDEVRVLRNKILHSIYNEPLYPREIISLILNTFTYFVGKDSWWDSIREELFHNPFYGAIDKEFEEASLIEVLENMERYFSRKELSKHFNQNLKNRGYFCPVCKARLEREDESISTKWAFLFPNNASSNIIKCVCCLTETSVIREDCEMEDCKGNVLLDKLCLTCLGYTS